MEMAFFSMRKSIVQRARGVWRLPHVVRWRTRAEHALFRDGDIGGWYHRSNCPHLFFDHCVVVLPNPGVIYLPLVAMLAYHWGARYAIIATLLQLLCVYVFFLPPLVALKPLTPQSAAELLTLAGVTGFVLAIVQLAHERRVAGGTLLCPQPRWGGSHKRVG
jgi:hypothetical protein